MTSEHKQSIHQNQPLHTAGVSLDKASAAVLMLHGRGASAQSILTLADELGHPPGFVYVAPQAAGHTWYPHSFLAPIETNEPWLSSALAAVDATMQTLGEAGLSPERVVLLGFSQGACLALEYAARHAQKYGGLIAFSGGLIGPEGTPREYGSSLQETPIFLGCSDTDAHIPLARVHESAEVLERLGGAVTKRIYPGMGHTINRDEIDAAQEILWALG
ncbi:MAG TPA: alpha/beta hydrolase [Rhodothermales bacterium]|nr:alpha/beta hydrolase [Rhodothermales bacterium]